MPVFRTRNRVEILRDMVARVVARSSLAGLTRNSAVYHVLAATADEIAEAYFQLARLRELFSVDRATGSDLDARAREIQPGTVTRRQALYASTTVVFSRPGIVGTIPIPSGTIVGAADAAGVIRYRTTAPGSILAGNTQSAPIPVTAVEAGTRGNVDANMIVRLLSRIAGVTAVTNPTAVTNGQDRESDADFRARIKAFVRSLSRGTVAALEATAKNARLTDGARVLFAKVFENPFQNGYVQLYIDDGTGNTDTFDGSTYILNYDVIVASALGGERRVFTTEKPIRDDGSFVLEVNTVAQVRGIDYVLNPATGQITFTTASYPTGLAPGDEVRAKYRFYTRLVREVQRIMDGDPNVPLTYPGIRAAGVMVQVLPPQTVPQTLNAGIAVDDGFNTITVAAQVSTAIQNYINGLNIGEDVIVAQIVEVAMNVTGMRDFQITSLTGSSPPVNQVLLENQVARIAANDISLI
jgi:uncharacterized phage protein gp47/JayE